MAFGMFGTELYETVNRAKIVLNLRSFGYHDEFKMSRLMVLFANEAYVRRCCPCSPPIPTIFLCVTSRSCAWKSRGAMYPGLYCARFVVSEDMGVPGDIDYYRPGMVNVPKEQLADTLWYGGVGMCVLCQGSSPHCSHRSQVLPQAPTGTPANCGNWQATVPRTFPS